MLETLFCRKCGQKREARLTAVFGLARFYRILRLHQSYSILPAGCWQASIPGSEKASLGGPSWMCGCIFSLQTFVYLEQSKPCNGPPALCCYTGLCTFCTFVCSFSHNFVSQAGSVSSMSRRLNKIPTLSFKAYTAFWKPPWQVLIISAIPKGFLSSAAKVCACLFWIGWKQLRLQCVLCISICEISWLRGTVSYIFLSVPFFQSLTSNSFLEDLCDICIFLRHWFLCVLLVMYRNVPHLYVLYFKLELRGGFSIHRQPWQSVFQHIATTLLPWMTCAKGLVGSSKRAGHE